MKIIQNFLLIFILFFFIIKDSFAGLGNTTLGPGGIKRDIEVNEIEEIEEIDQEEKDNESFNNQNFETIELKKIDLNTVGTLTEKQGGLGYDMWLGTEKNIILNYLKNLPINKESELAIDLIRKLLLSNADIKDSNGDNEIILTRINKLIELGDFENAKLLIDLIISNDENEEILRKQTEINLSLSNFDLVCSNIVEKRKKFKENFFWWKVEIFCQILNDESNKANLSLTLLKEKKDFSDENFFKIIDSLIYNEEIKDENLFNLDLLNLAMTRIANINIKEGYVLKEDPLFLTMIYRMPNVPIKLRIEAIEKSKKLLNLPTETIEEIYNSYEIDENDKKISLDEDILLGYGTQAILFQMAISEENEEKKVKIINKALEIAAINGNFKLISKLNLNSLLEIKPSTKLVWFANNAVKSLLILNEIDAAMEWYKILKNEKDRNVEIFNNFAELWPIIELFILRDKGDNKYENVTQEEIIKILNKFQSKNENLNFDTLGFYLLEVFGVKINPEIWLINIDKEEIESKEFPNTSLISLLKLSSEQKRVGETILLILMNLESKNFNQLHPFFLQIVISSLNQIGLNDKSFDLAIETLIDL